MIRANRVPRPLDEVDVRFAAEWIADEARRIERAARLARARAELVGAWLQTILDKHPDAEAVRELRRGGT